MIFVILLHKVLKDRARFEDSNLLAILESVCDGWYPTVRVYIKEPRFFLNITGDVEMLHFVRKAKFLECNRYLDSIWGAIRVQRDIWSLGVCHRCRWGDGLNMVYLLLQS